MFSLLDLFMEASVPDLRRVKTLCRMCDHGCGMEVVVEGEWPKEIRGWKEHPFNKGWLCIKGMAALDLFYSPHRIRSPLVRSGDQLIEVCWDKAFSIIKDKLFEIKGKYGPQALAIYQGEGVGHQEIKQFIQRFANVFGTPNFSSVGSICNTSRTLGERLTLGDLSKPDIPNTSCLLIWGGNPFASNEPYIPSEIHKLKKRGGKLIVIDPRKTQTANKADLFLQPMPGTDRILAINLLHVIFREGLWDKEFARRWIRDSDKFIGLISQEDFSPKRWEEVTKVPETLVYKCAWEFMKSKPNCIFTGNGIEHHTDGVKTAILIALIKAFSGNIDKKGGDLFTPRPNLVDISHPRPLPETEAIGAKEFPLFYKLRREANIISIIKAILTKRPYEIKAMIVCGGNLSMEMPQSHKVVQALKELEFLLVIDVVQSPDMRYAHMVLPSCTFLERDELKFYVYQNLPYIALRRGVVDPVYGMPDQMIWTRLGWEMGFEEYFPWKHITESIDYRLKDMGLSYKDLISLGGLYQYWDRTYEGYVEAGFSTPSKMVEIDLSVLEDLLPSKWEEKQGPLILTTGANLLPYTHWQFRYIPKLKRWAPEPFCEIHPETASMHGIKDSGFIKVKTIYGEIKLKAKVREEVLPGVLNIPQGFEEANVNNLTGLDERDPHSGFPNLKSLKCSLESS